MNNLTLQLGVVGGEGWGGGVGVEGNFFLYDRVLICVPNI